MAQLSIPSCFYCGDPDRSIVHTTTQSIHITLHGWTVPEGSLNINMHMLNVDVTLHPLTISASTWYTQQHGICHIWVTKCMVQNTLIHIKWYEPRLKNNPKMHAVCENLAISLIPYIRADEGYYMWVFWRT